MIFKNTYRKIIAAFLLLLYAFVATPTQFWHHHSVPPGQGYVLYSEEKNSHAVIEKTEKMQADKSCGICSHKYSTYNGNLAIANENSSISYIARNGFYHFAVIPAPSLQSSNKGPPSFC